MAHLHSVYDTDLHFSINAITRAIQCETLTKNSLIQYDHNSERFTFELPRYIEEHDMSLCNRVEVHYINIGVDGEQIKGVYKVDDIAISPDDQEMVICSWLIPANATQLAGSLSFLIRFACLTDDTIDYIWHTDIYNDIAVTKGMNNSEAILVEYPEVLEAGKVIGREEERIAFWKANQEGGNRVHYANAYNFIGWDDTNFNPVYPINTIHQNGIGSMFNYNVKITDTKVNIIVNNGTAKQAFANCSALKRIPYIEFNNCTNFENTFLNCKALEYIRVGGEIDKSIDLSACPLDLESAKSVLKHLKSFDNSVDGDMWGTVSVSFNADVWALLDAEGTTMEAGDLTWRQYTWTLGWTVLESEVPADRIFGGGDNNDHEVM